MSYKITSKKIVSEGNLNKTLTGQTVWTPHQNAGSVAIAVKLKDGRMAWGFAATESEAETAAVQAALAI